MHPIAFSGEIIAELERLHESDAVRVIDVVDGSYERIGR
jgi:hypothetical protein